MAALGTSKMRSVWPLPSRVLQSTHSTITRTEVPVMEREWPPKCHQDIRQGSQGSFHREDCTKVIHAAEIPRHFDSYKDSLKI